MTSMLLLKNRKQIIEFLNNIITEAEQHKIYNIDDINKLREKIDKLEKGTDEEARSILEEFIPHISRASSIRVKIPKVDVSTTLRRVGNARINPPASPSVFTIPAAGNASVKVPSAAPQVLIARRESAGVKLPPPPEQPSLQIYKAAGVAARGANMPQISIQVPAAPPLGAAGGADLEPLEFDLLEKTLGFSSSELVGGGTHLVIVKGCSERDSDDAALLLGRLFLELYTAYGRGNYYDVYYHTSPESLSLVLNRDGVHVISSSVVKRDVNALINSLKQLIGYEARYVVVSAADSQDASSLAKFWGVFKTLREVSCDKRNLVVLARAMSGLIHGDVPAEVYAVEHLYRLEAFWKLLAKPLEWLSDKYPLLNRPSVEPGESFIHRGLKAAAVKHLIRDMQIDAGEICVEDWCPGGGRPCGSLVPDVYVRSRGLAIDAKTAFGANPVDACREAFEKYASCASEVWCVVTPAVAAVYGLQLSKMLTSVRRHRRERGLSADVKIKVPVWKAGGGELKLAAENVALIDIEDFLKTLSDMIDGNAQRNSQTLHAQQASSSVQTSP